MARVPAATRESVPQSQQDAFDAIVQSRGGVPRTGPGSIMINSPEASRRASHLSEYLRRESTLNRLRTREFRMPGIAVNVDALVKNLLTDFGLSPWRRKRTASLFSTASVKTKAKESKEVSDGLRLEYRRIDSGFEYAWVS